MKLYKYKIYYPDLKEYYKEDFFDTILLTKLLAVLLDKYPSVPTEVHRFEVSRVHLTIDNED